MPFSTRAARGGTAAIAALAAALFLSAPGGVPAARAQAPSLTGLLLVATEELEGSFFSRTVIFMIRHDASGAIGLVVNRPFSDVPLAVLLQQSGMDPKGAKGTVSLFRGGPVATNEVMVLHSQDYALPDTEQVGPYAAVTRHPDILRAFADGKGPKQSLVALGYAGWAPGQLEGEMRNGAWFTATADPAILFDQDYATKWDRAMARRRISL